MKKGIFRCGYCCKEYTQAARFEKHFTICSYNNKKFRKVYINKKSNQITMGTLNTKLDKILLILESQNKRIGNLEKKIIKKREITKNIKLWLNNNIKIDFNFENWKNDIEVSILDYDYVISDGCVAGYSRILFNNINKNQDRFVYAFNGGTNKFYIYNNEWINFDNSISNKLIYIIQRKLIIMAMDKRDNIKNISERKERELLKENSIIYGKKSVDWCNQIYNNLYKKLKIKFDDII